MKAVFARVVENERLYGDTFVTWFDAPEILAGATPGQFVMLRCVEPTQLGDEPPSVTALPEEPFLPRAMSIHRVRGGSSGPEWSILFDVVGRGTRWLAARQPGDLVYCWGPLGHGFDVPEASQHMLLVAGGIGVAPLAWLADQAIARDQAVMLVAGGRTSAQIYPAALLPREVEVAIFTEDGSVGRKGLATAGFAEQIEWSDEVFACGPNAMFRAMAGVMQAQHVVRRIQVLLEERMGCGTGICYGCAVETRKGMRLVCKDGPKFDLNQVF
jgi:dihydroorotate dehydrogenase electron transfer subunit